MRSRFSFTATGLLRRDASRPGGPWASQRAIHGRGQFGAGAVVGEGQVGPVPIAVPGRPGRAIRAAACGGVRPPRAARRSRPQRAGGDRRRSPDPCGGGDGKQKIHGRLEHGKRMLPGPPQGVQALARQGRQRAVGDGVEPRQGRRRRRRPVGPGPRGRRAPASTTPGAEGRGDRAASTGGRASTSWPRRSPSTTAAPRSASSAVTADLPAPVGPVDRPAASSVGLGPVGARVQVHHQGHLQLQGAFHALAHQLPRPRPARPAAPPAPARRAPAAAAWPPARGASSSRLDAQHGQLDQVGGRALDGRVDGHPFLEAAHAVVAESMSGSRRRRPEQGLDAAVAAGAVRAWSSMKACTPG